MFSQKQKARNPHSFGLYINIVTIDDASKSDLSIPRPIFASLRQLTFFSSTVRWRCYLYAARHPLTIADVFQLNREVAMLLATPHGCVI